jgi:ABC-type uncharacterized transport system substrate-binding protein
MRTRVYTIALVMALSILRQPADASDTAPTAHADQPTVVIVTSSAIEAFEEAVRGIRQQLGPAAKVVVFDLAAKHEGLPNQPSGKDVRLLITVGNNALEFAGQSGTAPILATMLLRADLAGSRVRQPVGAVVLDLPLADVLARTANVFPGKTRAAIIRNPDASSASPSALAAQAKAAGMAIKVIDCPRPELLLQAFLSLKGQVDFVLCPPDGTLYNSATVRPLILASLEIRLPVVGFSASFVRTGAVAGVYPDYFDVGLQAGDLARKYLAGARLPANESPRKVKVAANPRVARLLGLRMPGKNEGEPGIVVIE